MNSDLDEMLNEAPSLTFEPFAKEENNSAVSLKTEQVVEEV